MSYRIFALRSIVPIKAVAQFVTRTAQGVLISNQCIPTKRDRGARTRDRFLIRPYLRGVLTTCHSAMPVARTSQGKPW